MRAAGLIVAGLLAAAPAGAAGVYGRYRAVLELPGGELPFGLVIAEEHGQPVAYLENGKERVPIKEVSVNGEHVELAMPGYGHRLIADVTAEGLAGEARMLRRTGKTVVLPLRATRGASYRFFPGSSANPVAFGGRWAVEFKDADGAVEKAIGEFSQSGTHVTGTFLTATGDHRYLAGDVRGRELFLSRFDGGSAYLYHALLSERGELDGMFWSGNWSEESWHGRRDEAATLADPAAGISGVPLEFTFPDLDGHPVSLSDFRGKVAIVAVGGSWCPNCHDEAEFLKPYYKKLHARGLEIVFLQFEYQPEFAAAAAANRRFAALYGIDWPILIAGTTDSASAEKKLPAFGRIYGWPTTAYVDRHGRIRRIHTGFSGPATGAHYEQWRHEFESLVMGLLAEPS
jgi:thiol-disulfide isomerase/thioredoxin